MVPEGTFEAFDMVRDTVNKHTTKDEAWFKENIKDILLGIAILNAKDMVSSESASLASMVMLEKAGVDLLTINTVDKENPTIKLINESMDSKRANAMTQDELDHIALILESAGLITIDRSQISFH